MRSIAIGGLAATILVAVAVGGCAAAGPSAPDAPVPTGAVVQAQLAELPLPSADSPVLAVTTVIEQPDGTLLCLGAVAESAPPQCSGLALLGWDWDAFEHQETGGVRWVQGVALEGSYDAGAQSFTQTGEPMSAAAITLPAIEVPAGTLDDATIEAVQADFVAAARADVLTSYGEQGTLVVEVVYDDGTVQAAIDEIYGPGVVFVISALRGGEVDPAIIDPPMDTVAPVITGADAQARLAELPTPVPAGPVTVGGTALEADSGPNAGTPMLCQMVLTSYPPQCSGPEIVGWDWSNVEHEAANGVRWTDGIAMSATWDAVAGTLTTIELLDPAAFDRPDSALPTGGLDATTMEAMLADIRALERGDVVSSGMADGIVVLDVIYDDGSMQAGFDELYGPGTVHVTSWLLG